MTSPVQRPWSKLQVLACGFAFLLAGAAIAWFAARHPAPQPTVFRASDFHQQEASLRARLKQDPHNFDLLVEAGNLAFDHQQYASACAHYREALTLHPQDVNVRSDLGTGLWLVGDPDGALRELRAALSSDPDRASTLEIYGRVLWREKHDPTGAIAAWEHLFAKNPNYPGRQRIDAFLGAAKISENTPK